MIPAPQGPGATDQQTRWKRRGTGAWPLGAAPYQLEYVFRQIEEDFDFAE